MVVPGLWVKADCGSGGLYSQTGFIKKHKMSCRFIKGVSGGCFVRINKWCYPQSGSDENDHLTYNKGIN